MKNPVIKLLIVMSLGAAALSGCDRQGGSPTGQQSSPSSLAQRDQPTPPAAQAPMGSPSTEEKKDDQPKS